MGGLLEDNAGLSGFCAGLAVQGLAKVTGRRLQRSAVQGLAKATGRCLQRPAVQGLAKAAGRRLEKVTFFRHFFPKDMLHWPLMCNRTRISTTFWPSFLD